MPPKNQSPNHAVDRLDYERGNVRIFAARCGEAITTTKETELPRNAWTGADNQCPVCELCLKLDEMAYPKSWDEEMKSGYADFMLKYATTKDFMVAFEAGSARLRQAPQIPVIRPAPTRTEVVKSDATRPRGCTCHFPRLKLKTLTSHHKDCPIETQARITAAGLQGTGVPSKKGEVDLGDEGDAIPDAFGDDNENPNNKIGRST